MPQHQAGGMIKPPSLRPYTKEGEALLAAITGNADAEQVRKLARAFVAAGGSTGRGLAGIEAGVGANAGRLGHLDDVLVGAPPGMTALCAAATSKREGIVDVLLEEGASVSRSAAIARHGYRKGYSESPLVCAAAIGSASVVRALRLAGAPSNEPLYRADELSALMIAALAGYHNVVTELLGGGGGGGGRGGAIVDETSRMTGETPLMVASAGGHLLTVKVLLRHGADVSTRDNINRTALYIAAQGGYSEVVKAIVAADPSSVEALCEEDTPLYAAADRGHTSTVRELLKVSGPHIDLPCFEGATALFMAAQNGHFEIASLLLKSGKVDCHKTRGYDGCTLLFAAAMNGHADIVQLLLRAGADINRTNPDTGASVLMAAVLGESKEAVTYALAAGADVQWRDDDGYTALFMAATMQTSARRGVISQLLAAGADVSVAVAGLRRAGMSRWADWMLRVGDSLEGDVAKSKEELKAARARREREEEEPAMAPGA